MTEKYVIAYDLGTSSVKVALVDLKGGFICDATQNYPLYTPHPGWAEQDPELYWKGVCDATQAVMIKSGCHPKDAQGMVFGTQWKGIIPVDAQGHVLHNSIIWLDNRADSQAKRLNEHFHEKLFCSADYWPKLLWFRENCFELYDKAVTIFEANSFLKWKATGVACVDVANNFIRSFDKDLQAFYIDYLEFCDMSLEKFPPLAKSTDLVGHLTEDAAKEMGLTAGIPVFAGCSDIPAITIGSGSTRIGSMHAYFGSSGWMGLTRAHSGKELYISPFDEERDVLMHGMQAIGLALNWTISQLYHKEMEEMGGAVYDFVNKEVESIPPGSDGVFVTPWLFGERPPEYSEIARGSFINLNSCHDRRHMVKAVMEGVCYTLRQKVESEWEMNGTRPTCLNAVGGGACSAVWMQALSDILELPVNVPRNPRHSGAIGTAYCALIGLGYFDSFEQAAEKMEIERRFQPRPEAVTVYRAGYAVFKQLYGALKPLFCSMQSITAMNTGLTIDATE